MTRIALFALMLIFACSTAHAAVMKAKLSKVKGDVQVKATAKTPWKAAKDGDTITESGQVKTGPGSEAFVAWGGGHVVKVGASSQISMSSLSVDGAGNSKSNIKLEKGDITAKAGKITGNSTFNVTTPTAVAGVRGTGFQCTINAVFVVDGSVAVTAGGVTVELSPGMFTEIAGEGMAPMVPASIPTAMLGQLQMTITVNVEVGEKFTEEYGDEDMTMDDEELEELEEDLGSDMEEDFDSDDSDADYDNDEDITDSIDSALEDDILGDIIDAAEEGDFLPGTGGIQGAIEF
jgi:hypothetical protein